MRTDCFLEFCLNKRHVCIFIETLCHSCLLSHEPKYVGNWALVVKRDYFNKVAGGVRQQEKLDAHSELVKIRSASFLYLYLVLHTPCREAAHAPWLFGRPTKSMCRHTWFYTQAAMLDIYGFLSFNASHRCGLHATAVGAVLASAFVMQKSSYIEC